MNTEQTSENIFTFKACCLLFFNIRLYIYGKKNNFMAPFYGWGSTASRLEPLRGGSLLFTTKFPETRGMTVFSYS